MCIPVVTRKLLKSRWWNSAWVQFTLQRLHHVFAAHVLHWTKSQSFPKDVNSYYLLIAVTLWFHQTTETYYQLTYSLCSKSHTCTKSTYLGPTINWHSHNMTL